MTVKELFRYLSQDQLVCIGNSEYDQFQEVPVLRVYGVVLGEVVEKVFPTGDILQIFVTGQKPSTYLAECPMCHNKVRMETYSTGYMIHCDGCQLTTDVYENKEVLADAWNTMCRRCK